MKIIATAGATLTEVPVYWENLRARVLESIEANFEESLEIGCMEHGGYDYLAAAVMCAIRGEPFDTDSVYTSCLHRSKQRRAQEESS